MAMLEKLVGGSRVGRTLFVIGTALLVVVIAYLMLWGLLSLAWFAGLPVEI